MINIIRDNNETQRVIGLLNDAFREATSNMGKALRTADDNTPSKQLYKWQVDYAYRINEITKAPLYIISKLANNCFSFIEYIKKDRNSSLLD